MVLVETGFVSGLYRCSLDGKVEKLDPAVVTGHALGIRKDLHGQSGRNRVCRRHLDLRTRIYGSRPAVQKPSP